MYRSITLTLTLVTVAVLVASLLSCKPIYEAIGFTPSQADDEIKKDAQAAGPVLELARDTFWQLVAAAIAALGLAGSTILAKIGIQDRKIANAAVLATLDVPSPQLTDALANRAAQGNVDKALRTRTAKLASQVKPPPADVP